MLHSMLFNIKSSDKLKQSLQVYAQIVRRVANIDGNLST